MPDLSPRRGFLKRAAGALAGTTLLGGLFKSPAQAKPAQSGSQGANPAGTLSENPFVGEIQMVAFNFAPVGWALCNGQLLPISQNTALFSLLGTTYGGDGVSTFALPNLQGRVPIHTGQGPGLTVRILGEVGGEEAHTLTSGEMPAHSHGASGVSGVGTSDNPAGALPAKNAAGIPQYGTGTAVAMNNAMVQSTGGGAAHNNMPPYLAINYIIALQGIYPSRP